ncbi:MAG: hypothetical protein P8M80_09530 [Pirellulaceae bacterium]|nr:hypothetical protein [Pirellulaceae bacterium]
MSNRPVPSSINSGQMMTTFDDRWAARIRCGGNKTIRIETTLLSVFAMDLPWGHSAVHEVKRLPVFSPGMDFAGG